MAFVVLGSTLANTARAQTPPPQSRGSRPDSVQSEQQRQFEMQVIEKALREGHPRRSQRYEPLVLEQIKSDFLAIQIIDRKLVHTILAPDTLDLRLVVTSAAEIRDRSKRLKRNLALPVPAPADRPGIVVEAKLESLRLSRPALSKLIDELVSNPMFEQSRLIDSQLAAKALQDIEAIVELSGAIKRSAEKLRANAKAR